MTTLFSKIKEVTELAAVSGHEAPVRAYLREKLTPHVDEVVTDGLGGIFGIKHSEAVDAPRVLVASHMDEVGFMVSEIKPDGTFRVVEIGGWNPMVVSSQRFKLLTRDGHEIPVISGSVPPHLTRGK
ncbi:TPA: glutamyl aminopeptidase, partial [Streptococcus pneumoniae]